MTGAGEPGATESLGTPAERTELAWVRTTLACAGLAVLALRLADDDAESLTALALGVLVAGPGLIASWGRSRELRARPVPAPPRVVDVAAITGSIALVDVVVLALLLR